MTDEEIFLDEVKWRVEQIKKASTNDVQAICDGLLGYIEQSDGMLKQKENYEQLLLDRLLCDGVITSQVYREYKP